MRQAWLTKIINLFYIYIYIIFFSLLLVERPCQRQNNRYMPLFQSEERYMAHNARQPHMVYLHAINNYETDQKGRLLYTALIFSTKVVLIKSGQRNSRLQRECSNWTSALSLLIETKRLQNSTLSLSDLYLSISRSSINVINHQKANPRSLRA